MGFGEQSIHASRIFHPGQTHCRHIARWAYITIAGVKEWNKGLLVAHLVGYRSTVYIPQWTTHPYILCLVRMTCIIEGIYTTEHRSPSENLTKSNDEY